MTENPYAEIVLNKPKAWRHSYFDGHLVFESDLPPPNWFWRFIMRIAFWYKCERTEGD